MRRGTFMDSSENQPVTKRDLEKLKKELITQYINPKFDQSTDQNGRPLKNDIQLIKKKLQAIEDKFALIETVTLKNQSYIENIISLLEILSTRFDEIISNGAFIDKLNMLFEGQNKIMMLLEEIQQDNLIIQKIAEFNDELNDWHWGKN